jgi:hypothetical protein
LDWESRAQLRRSPERRRSDMTTHPFRLNPGDWLHVVEFGLLLVTLGMFVKTIQYTESQVDKHSHQLDRIEHYLSSRDPEYWQRTQEGSIAPIN